MRINLVSIVTAASALALWAGSAAAGPVSFSTGLPDGKIATLSGIVGAVETETADDFALGQEALITGATFTGLLPASAPLSNITDVEVELYHIFPLDSANPPSGNVPTRVNSPSDVNFGSTFDFGACATHCSASILASSFAVTNSVVNGIHKFPAQTTGGDGGVTGEEVMFTLTFVTPFLVGEGDHIFFRPEVDLTSGDFLWLSAPKPIIPPGTSFPLGVTDLQAWIRNSGLNPDWLRIGTDIVGGAPAPTFNMTFSLTGVAVPEPATFLLIGCGLVLIGWGRKLRG